MMRRSGYLWLVVALAICSVAQAVPDKTADSISVYVSGASSAAVYIAPLAVATSGLIGSDEVSLRAFAPKFFRGYTPLQVRLQPGKYMVSLLSPSEWALKDGMAKVTEYTWTGYDHHAVVNLSDSTRWRYGHCYEVTKQAGQGATVFAVFAGITPTGETKFFAPTSGSATRYAGSDEEGLKQLIDGGLPPSLGDSVLQAMRDGQKAVYLTDTTRYVISVARPDLLEVKQGPAGSYWSGHKITICSGD